MTQNNYQGIGNLSLNGESSSLPGNKGGKQDVVGYSLLLLPLLCLVILIILITIAVDMVTVPSTRQQTKVANRYWEFINNAVEGQFSEKDIKRMIDCYPEKSAIIDTDEGEIAEAIEEVNAAAIEGQKIVYKSRGEVKVLEGTELERYAGHISLMEGMKDETVEVTAGSWITYDVEYEGLGVDQQRLMEELGIDMTETVELLVLECNGKLGVWGMYTKGGDEVYFWED